VRRVVGVVATAALVATLGFNAVPAASPAILAGQVDLGTQLMLRLFGETSDSSASFAAAHGDRASESPLRDLALQIRPAEAKPYAAFPVAAAFAQDRVALRDLSGEGDSYFTATVPVDATASQVRFSPPSSSSSEVVTLQPSNPLTAAYQPVRPEPNISPAPGTLAFASPVIPSFGTGDVTTQLGPVRFEGHSESASTEVPQLALRDTSYKAGANFDVQAGKRDVDVNLSSEYEQVGNNDFNAFSAAALDSAWQLPGTSVPLVIPNYAGLSRLSLGAGVSVPVVRGLTFNLNYNAQRLYGGYGLPSLVNFNGVNDSYGGGLTFNIPRISSSLSISASQGHFEDTLLPINGSTQTREDVNFTVKF
jgi:hypothetical protein